MAQPSGRPIKEELITVAQRLIQDVGVSDFSYADLAGAVGVTKASIHHHFARKDDLVSEVLARYCDRFNSEVDAISPGAATDRIGAYAKLFNVSLSEGLMCPCGTVAMEWSAVGERSQRSVEKFFATQVAWLTAVVQDGVDSGELARGVDSSLLGAGILAALEGTLLLNRAGTTVEPSVIVGGLMAALVRGPAPADHR